MQKLTGLRHGYTPRCLSEPARLSFLDLAVNEAQGPAICKVEKREPKRTKSTICCSQLVSCRHGFLAWAKCQVTFRNRSPEPGRKGAFHQESLHLNRAIQYCVVEKEMLSSLGNRAKREAVRARTRTIECAGGLDVFAARPTGYEQGHTLLYGY